MNSVILEKSDLKIGDIYTLSKIQSKHLLETVNTKLNDSLKVTILNEGIGKAVVCEIKNDLISLQITHINEGLFFPIELIIAASRPPTMKKVIEHGSSMGISKFTIVGADLTEKSYLQSKIYHENEFQELCKLGLSQSVNFYKMPEINIVKNVHSLSDSSVQKFILSPYAKEKFFDQKIIIQNPTVLAIGPERGWSEKEVNYFKSKNYNEVLLSPSILRVEIATIAAMGCLNNLMLN